MPSLVANYLIMFVRYQRVPREGGIGDESKKRDGPLMQQLGPPVAKGDGNVEATESLSKRGRWRKPSRTVELEGE